MRRMKNVGGSPGWRAIVAAVLCLGGAVQVGGQDRLTFIGVALDMMTRDADRRLTAYLSQKTDLKFAQEELEYGRMIDRLVNWKRGDGFFVARTTPYAYVVAEMLGADVEPLATYVSAATGRTTYHAYFVVSRKDFPARPSLTDLVRFVRERRPRPRFVYHSQFSTSSYFLPLLFFRSYNIFHMPESTESLSAIQSTRVQEASSSKLVELVAGGEAEMAAVWDDTKARYEAGRGADKSDVHFVELPTVIPNDLLVCSAGLDAERKQQLGDVIRTMGGNAIGVGDFLTWKSVADATDARRALADLRWLARERQAPVTVEIVLKTGTAAATSAVLVEAARQAVRLAGTEFVLFDQDFHEHIDVRWTLEPLHDGALALVSAIPGADIDAQIFRLSFRDTEDLTRRLVAIMQSRMHRIRYVWAFSGTTPMVMRDLAFALPADSRVKVQAITWINPERNTFRAGPVFSAAVRDASYYRYELDVADFVRVGGGQPALDPMSNSGYRVILLRPEAERLLFRILTVVLLAAFVLAALAAILDVVRHASGHSARTVVERP
jgi:ABC-type phosphate/phosphonate transport system substrate-binding protein